MPVRGFLRTEASAAAAGSSQLPHPKRPGTFGAPLQANHARKDYFLYELLPFALGLAKALTFDHMIGSVFSA